MSKSKLTEQAARYDVFISYSQDDGEWVRDWLVPHLMKAEVRVCTDHDFDIGVPVLINTENAIAASRHTLLVLTPNWVKSAWTQFEGVLVQSSDPAALLHRTLPVLHCPCDIPQRIAMLARATFTGQHDEKLELDHLIDAIKDVRRLPNRSTRGSTGQSEPTSEASITLAAAKRRLTALPRKRVPVVVPLPPGSRMELLPNKLFVGRDDNLLTLARALKVGHKNHPVIITGIGGIGKTQLASEFVHRYGQYFAGGVFWLNFAPDSNTSSELANCGGLEGMNLPGFDGLKSDDQVKRVIWEWKNPIPRLLVLDNCEDEKLLTDIMNRLNTGGSRLLVTSQCQTWSLDLGVVELRLDGLPRSKSVALLQKFRPNLPADDQLLNAIAAELGDLPLALHLAGSFLRNYLGCTLEEYLKALQHHNPLQHTSLRKGGRSPTEHLQNVKKTFAISYKRLKRDAIGRRATALLARASFFASGESIPRHLLLPTSLVDGEGASFENQDALRRILTIGLLEENQSNGALRMHRLLAAFVQEQDPDIQAQTAVETAVIAEATRLNDSETPPSLRSIQAHLQFVTDRAKPRTDEHAAALCYELNRYLTMMGLYPSAQSYCERALAIQEHLSGSDSLPTARIMNGLGVVLLCQGKNNEARALFERALEIEQAQAQDEATIGPEIDQLAALLELPKIAASARPLKERALSLREHICDPNHPLYQRIQRISEQIAIHIDIAKALDNKAILLDKQQQYSEAQPCYEHALALREDLLGTQHPHTIRTLTNLAVYFHLQKQYEEAKPLYERAMLMSEQVRGPEHPDTATIYQNLGELYAEQGDYTSARPRYERALAILEQVLGTYHLDTAYTLHYLACCLKTQGEQQQAAEYLRRAITIRTVQLGRDHPDTQASIQELQKIDPH